MRRQESRVEIFRRIALGLAGAVEQAHHGHPDFRAHGRIFATLAYPDDDWGMVALTPDDQRDYVRAHPTAFEPAKGAWGLQGATMVRLAAIDEETLGAALTLAWQTARARTAAMKARSRQRPVSKKKGKRRARSSGEA